MKEGPNPQATPYMVVEGEANARQHFRLIMTDISFRQQFVRRCFRYPCERLSKWCGSDQACQRVRRCESQRSRVASVLGSKENGYDGIRSEQSMQYCSVPLHAASDQRESSTFADKAGSIISMKGTAVFSSLHYLKQNGASSQKCSGALSGASTSCLETTAWMRKQETEATDVT